MRWWVEWFSLGFLCFADVVFGFGFGFVCFIGYLDVDVLLSSDDAEPELL